MKDLTLLILLAGSQFLNAQIIQFEAGRNTTAKSNQYGNESRN